MSNSEILHPQESAREMMRHTAKAGDGAVPRTSEAAMAQRVAAHKGDPQAPEHEVALKIKERVEAAEERAVQPHVFVGPNPVVGRGERRRGGVERFFSNSARLPR
jgi:hypothetical protein